MSIVCNPPGALSSRHFLIECIHTKSKISPCAGDGVLTLTPAYSDLTELRVAMNALGFEQTKEQVKAMMSEVGDPRRVRLI